MIKIYSDKTGKFYDTVDEANRAEFELKEKENLARIEKERKERELKEKKDKEAAERKAAAEKVDAAFKALIAAKKAYGEELQAFCKKYGTYHFTTDGKDNIPSLFDFFDNLFQF